MKKLFIRFLYLVLFCISIVACNDDGGNLPKGIQTGANARVLFAYPDNTYINFATISSAAVAFDVYSANSDLDRIEYSAVFNNFASGVASASKLAITVPKSSFVGGKATNVRITSKELATLFAIPGGETSLQGGDSFTFSTKVFLVDGRTFDATNSAPSITTSGTAAFTTAFTIFVGCPSEKSKIEGKYTSTIEYNDGGEPTGIPNEVTISFMGPEPFRYTVTDHTGKLYVPYGGKEYPADFFDICGTPVLLKSSSFGPVINYVPTSGEIPPFSQAIIDTSGPNTVIIFTWFETFNVLKASMKFVKKP